MGAVLLSSMVVVATVTGAVMVVPQVLDLHRGRSAEGVSASWAGVGIALNGWWVLFGVTRDVWAVVPVTLAGFVLYVVVTFQLLQLRGSAWRQVVIGVSTIGMIPLPALITGGWDLGGAALGFSYAVQFAPAAWTAVRSERLDGLSPRTWVLAWIEAVAWFGYGVAIGERALIIGGGGGGLMASLILARLVRRAAHQPALV